MCRFFYGEILSANAEHSLQLVEMETLLAVSDNDAYNALVCTVQSTKMGWQRVFQLSSGNGSHPTDQQSKLHVELRGQVAFNDCSGYEELIRRRYMGCQFQKPRLTEHYQLQNWRDDQPFGAIGILCVKSDGKIIVATEQQPLIGSAGDTLLSFVPASPPQPVTSVQSAIADQSKHCFSSLAKNNKAL